MSVDDKPSPLKITIVLPRTGRKPIGGFKVAYEYANYLARRGHTVSVVHPNLMRTDQKLFSLKPKAFVRAVINYFKTMRDKSYLPTAWFKIDPAVHMLWRPNLAARYIPDGDVVIATAWETAEWVTSYPPSKGRGFYLIQHLETWGTSAERTEATWKFPLQKIVISPWLQQHAAARGETSHLIGNGLDFNQFKRTILPEDRDRNQILMLHHLHQWKATDDGLAAFAIARQQIPELRLTLFGINPLPAGLPEGAQFVFQPSQERLNELYNQAAIFVSPSKAEGWALPPAEALMCGAAIAITDIGGHYAYGLQGETALLSPPGDPAAMAANIVRLVQDDALRLHIANFGHHYIQQYTWDRAGAALEAVLVNALRQPVATSTVTVSA